MLPADPQIVGGSNHLGLDRPRSGGAGLGRISPVRLGTRLIWIVSVRLGSGRMGWAKVGLSRVGIGSAWVGSNRHGSDRRRP
jgi:hypothetical protein